jgi:hypothetical protein
MTEIAEIRNRAIARLDVVRLYMTRDMAVTVFAKLYNAGYIGQQLLEETGPIEAEDLDRWADICMGVGE